MKQKKSHSSFWRNTEYDDYIDPFNYESSGERLLTLSKHSKAIGRFVNIITNHEKKINIEFKHKDNGKSYTDGETVVVSSNINESNYDSIVGLALHEGSHVLLTDFNVLKNVMRWLSISDSNPLNPGYNVPEFIKNSNINFMDEVLISIDKNNNISYFKDIINVIEDRRIDKYVRTTAPGYRQYYFALYDKFFNSKRIDKFLQSYSSKKEDWDSYLNRIINLINPNVTKNDLVKMGEIIDLIDLPNISRLKNTSDSINLAIQVYSLIASACEKPLNKPQDSDGNDSEQQDSDEQQDSNGNGSEQQDSDLDEQQDSDGNGNDSGNEQRDSDEFSDKEMERIQNDFGKQRDFINGDVKKTNTSKSNINKINELSELDLEDSDITYDGYTYTGSIVRYPTIEGLGLLIPELINNWYASENIESMDIGYNLGKLLAKKIQIKDENRDLIYNRQKRGRLDRRMLHEAGTGSSNIFNRVLDASKKPVNLHFSVDVSSSMGGHLWCETLKVLSMFATAAEKVSALNLTIDLRYSGWDKKSKVSAIYAYNSRKHNFKYFKNFFTNFQPNGITPESVVYEMLLKEYEQAYKQDADNIFITISDGQPNVIRSRNANIEHIHKMVKKIKNIGYNFAGFFIGDYGYRDFKLAYKEDAEKISTNDVRKIGKIINKKIR